MAKRTLELLESLLVDRQMTSGQLDGLLAEQVAEDQFLEYKDGRILTSNAASKMLRRYMSGFANAEGGVLIIGVDEKAWKVTGCTAPGGGALDEWASSCVMQIASLFSQRPEFFVVDHPHGEFLDPHHIRLDHVTHEDACFGNSQNQKKGKVVSRKGYVTQLRNQDSPQEKIRHSGTE